MSRQLFTLCLVVEDNKVLLGKKQRKLGKGYWNGFGGQVEKNETVLEAAIRECQEEVGITPTDITQAGVLTFHYAGAPLGFDEHEVHVFVVRNFTGTITPTDEMNTPTWFSFDSVPYGHMWEDDAYWMPQVLHGGHIEGEVTFDSNKKIVSHTLREVEKV